MIEKSHKNAHGCAEFAAQMPHKLDAYEAPSVGICSRRKVYEPVGYYFGGSDAICADCVAAEAGLAAEVQHDSDTGDDQIAAIFPDTESDSPEHCLQCEALILHNLTADGYAYVAEALADGGGRMEILNTWQAAYGDAF
jgi:hypothetical protein